MDTSPELVNPTGKFKIGSEEAELALNYAGAGRGRARHHLHHLPANYWDLSETNRYKYNGWLAPTSHLTPHTTHCCWCRNYFLHIFQFCLNIQLY